MAKPSPTKKFRFNKTQTIGSPDAETDPILMKAFVKNETLNALQDISNQKCVIIGRTGSGKSALLKYIEENTEKIVRIEPEAMSLRYLSNSTIINYFLELGINLNFFYKVLWKHVFIIELLKLYFGNDLFKKQNWFTSLSDGIKAKMGKTNERRTKAINYLKQWSSEFWLDTEHRIKELEQTMERKYSDEVGLDITGIKAKVGETGNNSEKIRSEFKFKAEKVINSSQADEIHEIISILKDDIFNDEHKRFVIIIDDLDKEWITTEIRYDIIAAMIEVIKEFRVFKGVKIIVALRDNLHQLLFAGYNHKGGQREKYKTLYINLEWEEQELEALVEKRLDILTENNLSVKEAFQKIQGGRSTGFKYIIERTFMRPRDVISYINHAIENANNKAHFSLDVIKKAEIYYSQDRLIAVEDEWGENYGDISRIYKFLTGKYNGFNLKNIREDEFIDIFLDENPEKKYKGELLSVIKMWKSGEIKFYSFFKEILFILYTIGIVGIKKGPSFPVQYFYSKESPVSKDDINNDCKIYVHSAFYSALKINVKQLEADQY